MTICYVIVWVLSWPLCWSRWLRHTPTIMQAKSDVNEAFRETHTWQKEVHLCIFISNTLACDWSSLLNSTLLTQSQLHSLNLDPKGACFYKSSHHPLSVFDKLKDHQVSFWLKIRRERSLAKGSYTHICCHCKLIWFIIHSCPKKSLYFLTTFLVLQRDFNMCFISEAL